jgi:hypothetical protein
MIYKYKILKGARAEEERPRQPAGGAEVKAMLRC